MKNYFKKFSFVLRKRDISYVWKVCSFHEDEWDEVIACCSFQLSLCWCNGYGITVVIILHWESFLFARRSRLQRGYGLTFQCQLTSWEAFGRWTNIGYLLIIDMWKIINTVNSSAQLWRRATRVKMDEKSIYNLEKQNCLLN